MKKVLLGTSAIALAGAFTTSANAVEWDVKVGGYFEAYAAYANSHVDGIVNEDFGGIDNKTDSEIHFKPSITLDNGLKIGADVQMEGGGYLNTPDTIDKSYIFVDGSFGRVLLGSENSAGYLMHYGAPDVTFVNVNSGSLTKFIPFSGFQVGDIGGGVIGGVNTGSDIFRGTLGSTYIENDRNNDANRFTYFTPRFAGFQLGVSYARDGNQDTNAQLNLDTTGALPTNIFDIGANYVNSIGGVDIALSGRWGMADENVVGQGDPEIWATGLNLGYAGFTIGGSFAEQNNSGAQDGQSYDAGISYETGPWGFSFTYFHGRNVDNELAGNGLGADEKLAEYLLGVSYTVAKGVALNGFGAYAKLNEDFGDGSVVGATTPGNDVDGWVIGTGLKISF